MFNAKYYKLLKDLPTFKKGDLFRLSDKGSLFLVDPNPPHWKDEVMAYHHTTLEHFPNILKDWFEEVEEPSAVWRPKIREGYYMVSTYGDATPFDRWANSALDNTVLSIGNVFRTEEEAKKAIEWLKARKVLFDDAKGFKPDWKDTEQRKWSVYCVWNEDEDEEELCSDFNEIVNDTPGPYFATKEDAARSIREHRKEWLTYLSIEEDEEE